MSCTGCPLGNASGWRGDAGCGDDWADPARALCQREVDQGDRSRAEGVAQHGAEGAAFGGDLFRVFARGPAAAEAGTLACRSRPNAGDQRSEERTRASNPDTPVRGTERTW